MSEKDAAIEALEAAAKAIEAPKPEGGEDEGNPEAGKDEAKPEEGKDAAKPEDTDALSAAMTSVEDKIVRVAGLQGVEGEVSEAVAAVDLDAVKADVAAIMDDATKTPEEQAEALKAIEEQLAVALPEEVEQAGDDLPAVQARLDAAEAEVQQLSDELVEKLVTIDDLNAQIEDLGKQAETDATQLEALQTQLADAESAAEVKSAELAEAKATYEKSLNELEAYRVKRDPASGEAHIATAVENAIEVAPDGVTATWQYSNSDLSGNAATLTLVLDGEEIYKSEALKPGEVIESITLAKPLAPGAYDALAVTTVYDESGEVQLTSRVPVTLNVAE